MTLNLQRQLQINGFFSCWQIKILAETFVSWKTMHFRAETMPFPAKNAVSSRKMKFSGGTSQETAKKTAGGFEGSRIINLRTLANFHKKAPPPNIGATLALGNKILATWFLLGNSIFVPVPAGGHFFNFFGPLVHMIFREECSKSFVPAIFPPVMFLRGGGGDLVLVREFRFLWILLLKNDFRYLHAFSVYSAFQHAYEHKLGFNNEFT